MNNYDAWEKTSQCAISKISPCDNVEIIGPKNCDYLIKVTSDNITDVYYINKNKEFEKIEENIVNIAYDPNYSFYIITKNDGHIKYVNYKGEVIFTTDDLEIKLNNLSVTYLKGIDKFRVTNNNLTKIYSRYNENNTNKKYDGRLFSSFDVVQINNNYTFIYCTEILGKDLITKLLRIGYEQGLFFAREKKEIEILKGNFQVENIVLDGKRIIFSVIDSKTGKKKYGVIETKEGNICIDCDYNNMNYDSCNHVFICNTDDEKLVFDIDGFINENQNIEEKSSNQRVLKLTL